MSLQHSSRCVVMLSEYHLQRFYTPAMRHELESLFPELHHLDPDELPEETCLARLRQINPEVLLVGWESYAMPGDYPVGNGGLRYLCNTCGGIRNLVPRGLIDKGLIVTDWGSAISHTVAEGALLLMLGTMRRLTENYIHIRETGRWNQFSPRSMFGKTVGFHGFGRVARSLVLLLRPFQLNISVYAPGVAESVYYEFDVHPAASLEEVFSNDLVVELEALTPATEGIVTEAHLRTIPEGGAFINVARAGIVVEEALLKVASEGKVHFGLDVFHREPLAHNSPFRTLSNVVVTPHWAGPTPDALTLCGAHAIENLRRWIARQPLDSVIDDYRFDLMT